MFLTKIVLGTFLAAATLTSSVTALAGQDLTFQAGRYEPEDGSPEICRAFEATRVGNAIRVGIGEFKLGAEVIRRKSKYEDELNCDQVQESDARHETGRSVLIRKNSLECQEGIRRMDTYILTLEQGKITYEVDTMGATKDTCVFRKQ